MDVASRERVEGEVCETEVLTWWDAVAGETWDAGIVVMLIFVFLLSSLFILFCMIGWVESEVE